MVFCWSFRVIMSFTLHDWAATGGGGLGRTRLAHLQASLVSFSTQVSYEVLDSSKRHGRYCSSTKFSSIAWVKAVCRSSVLMLKCCYMTKLPGFTGMDCLLMCRCNNNMFHVGNTAVGKYCSYMGDPSLWFSPLSMTGGLLSSYLLIPDY